jgi:hypothetical protein
LNWSERALRADGPDHPEDKEGFGLLAPEAKWVALAAQRDAEADADPRLLVPRAAC